jgi:acetyl esterase/lipase
VRIFSRGVVLAVCMAAGFGFGQEASVPAVDGFAQGGKTMLLWPDGAPGAKGSAGIDEPTLTVYLPAGPNATPNAAANTTSNVTANPTRTGVVIPPGGGYVHLAMEKEGTAYAQWLNAHGVAAFVLKYRLGPKYHYPVELEDAQRAIRMVRAHVAEYGVDADRIGMWGSSAGGHLTATAGTHFDAGNPRAEDVVERQGSRPDFLILAYPVITFEEPELHRGSKLYLLGNHPSPKLVRSLSDETQVTKETPPTFLFATTDDKTVPVMNSVMFYSALVKAGVPAEMHLFQHGSHGAGLAAANPDLSVWPSLLAKWMRERGYMAAGAD